MDEKRPIEDYIPLLPTQLGTRVSQRQPIMRRCLTACPPNSLDVTTLDTAGLRYFCTPTISRLTRGGFTQQRLSNAQRRVRVCRNIRPQTCSGASQHLTHQGQSWHETRVYSSHNRVLRRWLYAASSPYWPHNGIRIISISKRLSQNICHASNALLCCRGCTSSHIHSFLKWRFASWWWLDLELPRDHR